MKNKFYSHILTINPVHDKLSELDIQEAEKEELIEILHSHIHVTVIDIILSELDEGKKKEFLHLVGVKEDNEGAWDFVLAHIEEGEDKVRKAIDQIVSDFIADLESNTK